MSSSASFTGSGFALQSVTPTVPGTVRVRFTSDPIQASPVGANDGLNITNYTLTGPGLAIISSISVVSGDTQSLDLHLTAPLPTGIWTLAVANIQTPTLASLGNPSSLQFTIAESGDATSLTAGAENDDTPDRVIRKHLTSYIQGDNTDALIEGLSQGDDINWNNTQLAFDQLFRSTASGKYLDRLAANDGVRRKPELGLSDDLFRKLLIQQATNKVTHNALRGILEVFYGQDALRAWVETELEEPYQLAAGQTLTWKLDAQEDFSVTFAANQFVVIGQAKAVEIAAVLTKAMGDAGSDGFALVVKNATTGNNRVRIYSGSLGLKSFAQVTGGTAQPYLNFNAPRDVYSGTVTTGSGYTWQYTNPTPLTTRLTLTTVGVPLIDVSAVETGDYVVIGDDVGVVPAGTYSIADVGQSWSGLNYVQYFEIGENLGYTGGALQVSNYSYQFFRPEKTSTQSGDRTVVVSQTSPGVVDIQLPATTQAVNRNNEDGAYLHGNSSNAIQRYWRDETGVLTVETAGAHGRAVNDWVQLDMFQPHAAHPWISPATGGGSDGGFVSGYRGIPSGSVVNKDFSAATLVAPSKVLFAGGATLASGVYAAPSNAAYLLEITGETAVTDASLAEGALRKTYTWTAAANLAAGKLGHRLTTLPDGTALEAGGFSGVVGSNSLATASTYSIPLNTWTARASMSLGRQGHGQILMGNNKVLAVGGAINQGTATPTAEIYDPSFGTWSAAASMTHPRYKPAVFNLPDGKVMVAGGYALGRENALYPVPGVYWKFDELAGTTLADAGPDASTLTMTNAPVYVAGKVNGARRFSGTSYASGASSAGIKTDLLDGWIVDFWLPEAFTAPAGDRVIVAHKGAGELSADNTLVEVGIAASGKPYWKFESGAGVDSREEVTASDSLTNGRHHVVIKCVVSGAVSNIYATIDNALVQNWTNYAAVPDGGGSGQWWVCGDPESANPWDTGFRGAVDEIQVAPYDVANDGVDQDARHVRQAGWTMDGTEGIGADPFGWFGGEILNTTEIYDPVGNTWTMGPNMRYCGGGATAIDVGNGRTAVYPSTSYDPTLRLRSIDAKGWEQYYPNQPGNLIEIYDHNVGRWYPGPRTTYRYFEPTVANLVSGLQHHVASSDLFRVCDADIDYDEVTFPSPEQSDYVELVNWRRGSVGLAAHANTVYSDVAVRIEDGLVAFGGGKDQNLVNTSTAFHLWSKHSDAVTGRGLDGKYKILSVPTSSRFTVQTGVGNYSANFGPSLGGGIQFDGEIGGTGSYSIYYGWMEATSATRASNITTITVPSTTGIAVGDKVFFNSNSVAFPAGMKTVTAVTATTFSYAETAANVGATTINGGVGLNYDAGATYELQACAADATKGPIIFDPRFGLATTSVDTTTDADLGKGSQLNQLVVASTAGFPDGEGYLVFDFGGPKQSSVIKYLEVIGSETLLMDYGTVVPENYQAGTKVTLLFQRGPYAPINEDFAGIFYATGSNLGRVEAEKFVRAAAAAGISVNVDVVYPGDRGLGAEGAPTEDAARLSDAVWVWGPDEFES